MRISPKKEGDNIPCPHYKLRIVGRSHRHASAVASAAYQSGEKLKCEFDHRTKNYSARNERILHTEIMLPENAPESYRDRETLWNAVEMNENHPNAQYARRLVMALPQELSEEENLAFARQYLLEQFVSKGMCVDWAYHYDGGGNPHIHVLTTMRAIDENGKWMPKCRKEYVLDKSGNRIRMANGEWKSRRVNTTDWDDRGNLEKWRHAWEVLQNEYLEKAGRPERIDMRSYERQGNGLIPTIHLGPDASAMEKRGIHTELGNINREIREHNALIRSIRDAFRKVREWVNAFSDAYQEVKSEQAVMGPSIRSALKEYLDARVEERSDWYDATKTKMLAKDMVDIVNLSKWLEAHGITHTAELVNALSAMEEKYHKASIAIKKNDDRRRQIGKILSSAESLQKLRPVFEQCQRIHFKKSREAFEREHEDELKASRRAYGFLMHNHGGKADVDPHEFDDELSAMAKEDAVTKAELESIKKDLMILRKAKNRIAKVHPEMVGERRSIRDELAEADEQNRQKSGARRADEKKKEQDRE